jgi:GDP-L-fucose synthase
LDLAGSTVLVAGGTGLIGGGLVRRLAALGARVRATHCRHEPTIDDPCVTHVRADLTRGEDCQRAVAGARVVFLCAASTSGAAAIASTPMIHVTPNVLINTQMLDAAYAAGVETVVFVRSTTVYPPTGDRPVHEDELMNGDPYDKYYFVGWMKRFTEVLCRMYGERLPRRMNTIALRATNVYGPGDRFAFATSHVLPALVRKVVERWDPIEVWGTGDDVRDLLYVDDMVDAMVRSAERLQGHHALNVGAGTGVSVKELLRTICALDGYADARVVYDPTKPTMIPIRLVDTARAADLLDFRPRVRLEDGLARTIAWYRATRTLERAAHVA